jgi:hypothetical protein
VPRWWPACSAGSAATSADRQSRRPEVSGDAGELEAGVTEVGDWTVTSTKLVVVVGGDVSTDVIVDGGTDEVTVTGTAETVLVGGTVASAGRGPARPAMSSAATSNPVAKPASPVTAAEPQVGRPLIEAPPRHAQRRYED